MKRYLLAALALALAVGTTVVFTLRLATGTNSPVAELARAAPERTFPARLSIETPYRPCVRDSAREDELVPRENCGEPGEARINLHDLEAGGESFHPDSLQAAALASVIWNIKKEGSLDAAIARLERAQRFTTNLLPILVDLSGVHLVRAQRAQTPQDLLAAVNYAEQVLKLDPRNRLALYNAALGKQALGLDDGAAEAWDAYLAVDSRSQWAEEARRRKARLRADTVAFALPQAGARLADVEAFARANPQTARTHGMETVLDNWGRAVLAGDRVQAAVHLALAEGLGLALERRAGGDASLADAVRAIRAARGNSDALNALAKAHQSYAAGQRHLFAGEIEAAVDAANQVVRARPESVLLQWALLLQGSLPVLTGGRESAQTVLSRLLMTVDSVRYPALAGRVRSTLGTAHLRDTNFAEARALSIRAEEQLLGAGELEYAASARSTNGEAACKQGDTVQAYRSIHRAQMELRRYRNSRMLHNNLHGLADCALERMPYAALVVLDEDVRVAEHIPDGGVRLLDALQKRARARTVVGDHSGAEADMDSASSISPRLPDRISRSWATAALAVAAVRGDSAVGMDSAVAQMSKLNVLWMFPALIRRADARLAAGDVAGATSDLEAVVTRVRALSREESDPALRQAMVEQARDRFDRLVMLYLRLGRPADALRALEQGRVSFAPTRDGQRARDIRLRAPAGEVALEYALIADTLLTWVIRGDDVHLARQTIDRDQFLLAVEQVGAAMESPAREAAARPALRSLYDWLIHPVRGRLGPRETRLVIVADGEVAGIPFNALMDSGNRHLVQSHIIRHAPTLADAARPRAAGGATGPALLVADPAFDEVRNPLLDRLPGTRREVNALSALFDGEVSLANEHATREAFVERAQSASLIHYAGHAFFDDARPERSYLLLAGADTTGRLTAEQVRQMRLGHVRLVVLSACRTQRAAGGRSGGFAGLSGALLSAGAGGVVGSLWEVNDGRAQPLMEAFHRAYRDTPDAARALRTAQLQMMESGDSEAGALATWAGFRYTGN